MKLHKVIIHSILILLPKLISNDRQGYIERFEEREILKLCKIFL